MSLKIKQNMRLMSLGCNTGNTENGGLRWRWTTAGLHFWQQPLHPGHARSPACGLALGLALGLAHRLARRLARSGSLP